MDEQNINWQLVPTHINRLNVAEREIRIFRNNFMAVLASTDKNSPIQLWNRLLPLAATTLNILWNSTKNPRLLLEAELNGQFNYDATPIAPPGTKAIIHEKS